MSLVPTVLVVDDVDATRSGLAELLQLRGYQTRQAANGVEALRWLREDATVRVVVLDLAMPDSNGYWFRNEQLMDPGIADVPVIIFTGQSESAEIRKALRVTHVMQKPVAVDALLEAIERCCGRPATAHL